jgi:hypothetical protein
MNEQAKHSTYMQQNVTQFLKRNRIKKDVKDRWGIPDLVDQLGANMPPHG